MKKQPQVIFINELKLALYDEYFYKKILERILEIKSNLGFWRVLVLKQVELVIEIHTCACLDTSKAKLQPWHVLVLKQVNSTKWDSGVSLSWNK